MLRIFTNSQHKFAESKSWIHLASPTKEEIQYVSNLHHIPEDFFQSALDQDERARLETDNGISLLIIHAPLRTKKGDTLMYRTMPIGIISTENVFITVCKENYPVFIESSENRIQFSADNIHFTWIQSIARHYLKAMDELNKEILNTEKSLKKSIHNKDVYSLLYLNKSLVFFTKSLKSNQAMLNKFLKTSTFQRSEQDDKLIQYALIEMQQAYDTAYIHNINLSNLMDAYAAVIENNVSAVLKSLTAFAFILTIPLVAASLYGMNTPLPFQDEGPALTVIMSAAVVLSGITAWFFYKKRLF